MAKKCKEFPVEKPLSRWGEWVIILVMGLWAISFIVIYWGLYIILYIPLRLSGKNHEQIEDMFDIDTGFAPDY